MNRLIAFRAWDMDKEIMIYDHPTFSSNGEVMGASIEKHYDMKVGDSIHALIYRIGTQFGTLMQFTGAKNKHGEDIYEGDVVKICSDWESKNKNVFEIKYMTLKNCGDCTHDSGIGFNFYLNDPDELITIGNIFEMKYWTEL